jgi:FkbM family methyltransferase
MRRRDFMAGTVTGATATAAMLGAGAALGTRLEDPGEQGRTSYSEQGEDLVLYHVVRDVLRVETATYMDVGAAYPVKGNNTCLLYLAGGRGVLVEPNPRLAAQLRERRPRDVVVAAGVGVDEATEADYFVITGNDMLNTCSRERIAELERERGGDVVARVMKMPLVTLTRTIAEHFAGAPDVLSTDVEGMDFDILRTLDFDRQRPGAICAESAWTTSQGAPSPITELLLAKGYVPSGGPLVNTIYVDRTRAQ